MREVAQASHGCRMEGFQKCGEARLLHIRTLQEHFKRSEVLTHGPHHAPASFAATHSVSSRRPAGAAALRKPANSARCGRTSVRTQAAKQLHFNSNGEALKRMQVGPQKRCRACIALHCSAVCAGLPASSWLGGVPKCRLALTSSPAWWV